MYGISDRKTLKHTVACIGLSKPYTFLDRSLIQGIHRTNSRIRCTDAVLLDPGHVMKL